MTDYAQIEDAALAALAPMDDTHNIRTRESYGGQFNENDIWQTVIQFPAVMVFASGFESVQVNQIDRQAWELIVYVAEQNSRGDSAARRGDTGSTHPGAFSLVEAARAKLNRLTIPNYGALRLVSERVIGFSKQAGVCVIEARYQIITHY